MAAGNKPNGTAANDVPADALGSVASSARARDRTGRQRRNRREPTRGRGARGGVALQRVVLVGALSNAPRLETAFACGGRSAAARRDPLSRRQTGPPIRKARPG